ncbi:MAG TPA: C40 family peptidase [Streptosporangiaceae bacterium]|nr:C40 family peptidase [Streptosporangiaceae bacterium]
MRRPNRRVLPTVIGVTVVTTLAANVAVLAAHLSTTTVTQPPGTNTSYVLGANASLVTPSPTGPVRQLSPDLLIAGAQTLTPDLIAKLRKVKGVKAVEVVDAAQALVAGNRVGRLLGVDPVTFRAYTPKPTADSDQLWRNIAGGDVAVSFLLGKDGGVALGSEVLVGGSTRQAQTRVGALATMGIGDVDAVVSHATAKLIGMPSGNALLISAPKVKLAQLNQWLMKKLLPKGVRSMVLNPKLDYTNGRQLPQASGTYLTSLQIQTAIAAGRTKLGVPYVYGGNGPNGYDCSSFVKWSLAQAGITMPRVAADQARTGPIVPYSQAQVGDLLIWANDPTAPGYIDHIAIYLGNGQMLVAPHTGTVIQVENVYTSNLRGAVRVNPQLAAQVAGQTGLVTVS